MQDILFALWFFAPAGIANSVPVFAAHIKSLEKLAGPIDGGKSYRGKRILGANTTFRGLVSAVIAGIAIGGLQIVIYNNNQWVSAIVDRLDYSSLSILLLGGLLGTGAIIGDAIKSFFKRQVGVASGKSWFPFDQIDYVIGGIIFSMGYVILDVKTYLLILGFYLILHLATVYVGWLLKLRTDPI
jgi:CDP-2,3-bis-(O-geranylgeranyl)-sn-glycerol synthase